MTDKEHALKIREAINRVHDAMVAANEAGLEVTFKVLEVGTFNNPRANRIAFEVKRPVPA